MRYIFLAIIFITFSSDCLSQQLIKHQDDKAFKLDDTDKIFSSNAGYAKIYRVNEMAFILWNGYSDVEKTTIIDRNVLDEIIRGSRMIKDADYGDIVQLETIPIDIEKAKMIGTVYYFRLYKTNQEFDLSNLTYKEVIELSNSSNMESVEADGKKVLDKVSTITSEVAETWMSLSERQLKKLINLNY